MHTASHAQVRSMCSDWLRHRATFEKNEHVHSFPNVAAVSNRLESRRCRSCNQRLEAVRIEIASLKKEIDKLKAVAEAAKVVGGGALAPEMRSKFPARLETRPGLLPAANTRGYATRACWFRGVGGHFARFCYKNLYRVRQDNEGGIRSKSHMRDVDVEGVTADVKITVEPLENLAKPNNVIFGVDVVRVAQKDDEDIKLFVDTWLKDKEKSVWDKVATWSPIGKTLWSQWNRMTVINGILYRKL
jgi:hypothetical protein